jgi:kynurenine formamidase
MEKKKIVDLTFKIENNILTYPTKCHPKVEIKNLCTIAEDGRRTSSILVGSHTGTHMDAPAHFIENGITLEQIPLEILTGESSMISFAPASPLLCINKDDIKKEIDKLAVFPERLLLHFGWDSQFGNMNYYTHSPYLSAEACHYLVESGIKLLGMDIPSADNPNIMKETGVDSPNHKILLENNIVLVEYMTNLEKLKQLSTFHLCVLPINLQGVDGAPVRAIAITE